MADAIGNPAVGKLGEAADGEGWAGDGAAEPLAADGVAGRDAHAGVDVEAGVVRRPAARTTAGWDVVRVGGRSVVGLELSGAQGQGAAGFQGAGVGRLVGALAREPVVAPQAHPRQPP
jgi:hypothetical protein